MKLFRLRNLPFRTKLLLYAIIVGALTLTAACSSIVVYDLSTFRESMVSKISAEADIVGATVSSAIVFFDPDFAAKSLAGLDAQPDVTAACIYTDDGTVFARYERNQTEFKFPRAPDRPEHRFRGEHLEVFRDLKFDGEKVGMIFIRVELSELATRVRRYLAIVAVVMAVSLLAVALLSSIFQGFITRPVMELVRTAHAVSADKDYSARATQYSDDELGRLTAAFNEMLDQIQARDSALRQSEERNRSLIDNIEVGVALIDADYTVLTMNPVCRAQAAAPAEPGAKCWRVMHGRDALCPDCPGARTLQSGRAEEREFQKSGPGGHPAYYRVQAFPVLREDGSVGGFIELSEDITGRVRSEAEKKELEQQLLQAQKMEAVGQLAGGMAHDFNNLLTVIRGNADLALMSNDLDPENVRRIKMVTAAVDRAKDLTMKLLTFSRKEQIDVRDVRIENIIRDLSAMLQRSLDKRIWITTNLVGDCLVRVDANQIQQALLNVCVNAGDAMPGGGTLTIECREYEFETSPCRECGREASGRYCLIQISDTGCGIDKSILGKVSEPFFTTKGVGKGTGLGLSITHGIVQNHNGHFHIYSEPGVGTCVKIFLPLSGAAEESPQDAADEEIPGGHGMILVIDDEPDVLDLAGAILRNAGYTPLLANGGRNGLRLFKDHSREIRAVVLDMIMPDIGGSDVFHELRNVDPNVKVLLSSGYSINGQAGDLMREGIQEFLQKPFKMGALCRALKTLLDS